MRGKGGRRWVVRVDVLPVLRGLELGLGAGGSSCGTCDRAVIIPSCFESTL